MAKQPSKPQRNDRPNHNTQSVPERGDVLALEIESEPGVRHLVLCTTNRVLVGITTSTVETMIQKWADATGAPPKMIFIADGIFSVAHAERFFREIGVNWEISVALTPGDRQKRPENDADRGGK